MPNASIVPPAAAIAAGTTSRRSVIALAPKIRIGSAPFTSRIAAASACVSCATRRSDTIVEPMDFSRSSSAARLLSSRPGLVPGRDVEISATRRGANGMTLTTVPARSASSTRTRGAAKGMILIVASICRADTRANGMTVASVMDSSSALRASTFAASISAKPASVA